MTNEELKELKQIISYSDALYVAKEDFNFIMHDDAHQPINPLLIRAFDSVFANAQEFIETFTFFMEKYPELLDKAKSKEVEDEYYKIYDNLE